MDERPTHLDLFSGIGGFALAVQWAGFRTIGFCEIDKYCREVLAKNFLADSSSNLRGETERESNLERNTLVGRRNGTQAANRPWPDCKIFGNIFDLDGRQFAGVSLITGGFPCQPFSVAGKRRGSADDRAIWPEMFRVISEARPAWILGENVPGIIPMELDNVLSDLEGIGYATRSFIIPACAVDARHRRDRLWIIAYCNESGLQGRNGRELPECTRQRVTRSSDSQICDTTKSRLPNWAGGEMEQPEPLTEFERPSGREIERNFRGMAHGVSRRVHRLKGLGNAIVPQVAYEILKEIRKLI